MLPCSSGVRAVLIVVIETRVVHGNVGGRFDELRPDRAGAPVDEQLGEERDVSAGSGTSRSCHQPRHRRGSRRPGSRPRVAPGRVLSSGGASAASRAPSTSTEHGREVEECLRRRSPASRNRAREDARRADAAPLSTCCLAMRTVIKRSTATSRLFFDVGRGRRHRGERGHVGRQALAHAEDAEGRADAIHRSPLEKFAVTRAGSTAIRTGSADFDAEVRQGETAYSEGVPRRFASPSAAA